MLPNQELSSQVIRADFRYPRNIPRTQEIDYSLGGVNFNDPSEGLEVKAWRGVMDGGVVSLETLGVPPVSVLSDAGMIRFSFTFDQNMNRFIAYETESSAHYVWFDPTVSDYVTSTLPAGSQYARCGLDDHRALQTGTSDIILAYLRNGSLYFRAQRDRYLIEYLLETGLDDMELRQVGMNEKYRFQFQLLRA
jgi:hypothetical protein